ncbi:PAS-domain containing protein [Paramylibacter kogurei]|uniref:PAS-domain containing protein n=1 Tax=Paramylibacter kogurei TaxID=1889778 RepID=UPI0013FDEBAE|nr:PAS-domain containing protein [Amylibacter kogurei]
MPISIWCELDGKVFWANENHLSLWKQSGKDQFTIDAFNLHAPIVLNGPSVGATLSIPTQPDARDYEICLFEYEGREFYFALTADSVQNARIERQRFVENISESFANSPTGIAVFDQQHGLSMFNPALTKLLDIPPSWLASSPSIEDFLSKLRYHGAMPEPRDFNKWRTEFISDLNDPDFQYQDDWNMPNGSIYNVSAYPNSNGAVTFYFEDISGRVLVEREYRSHLDNLYNAFDALDCAVIMFERSGEMAFANQEFDKLWGKEFSRSVVVPDIIAVSRFWSEQCMPSPTFGDLRDFVFQLDDKETWTADLTLKTGEALEATFTPLINGQTFCVFQRKAYGAQPPVFETHEKSIAKA